MGLRGKDLWRKGLWGEVYGSLGKGLWGRVFRRRVYRSLRKGSRGEGSLREGSMGAKVQVSVGPHAFTLISPSTWNDLPLPLGHKPSVNSFNFNFKTFLFPEQ